MQWSEFFVCRCVVIGAALLLLTGCNNPLAQVAGKVTLDGEPLAGGGDVRATVSFFPEGGVGTTAVGILNEEGIYELSTGARKGVHAGVYSVAVSATKVIIPQEKGGTPSGRPFAPRKYASPATSGFRANVEPGQNTFDFELQSDSNSK